MPFFKQEEKPGIGLGRLDTVLGTNTSLQGVIKSDGNIRVDGVMQGHIETAGNVVIGPSARVVADISANAVQVWGQVQGNIDTVGRLEILSSGRVFGELSVGALMIDEGGLFRGQCYMDGENIETLGAAGMTQLLSAASADGNSELSDATALDSGADPSTTGVEDGDSGANGDD